MSRQIEPCAILWQLWTLWRWQAWINCMYKQCELLYSFPVDFLAPAALCDILYFLRSVALRRARTVTISFGFYWSSLALILPYLHLCLFIGYLIREALYIVFAFVYFAVGTYLSISYLFIQSWMTHLLTLLSKPNFTSLEFFQTI